MAEINGIELYVLQANANAEGWRPGFGVPIGEHSLLDYARIVRGMDLVITVDTMTAHLAGALGVPVWNLLHAEADWRWMQDRADSPWYPTMRLFRQPQPDQWQPVIEQVANELEKLAASAQHQAS